MMHLFVSLYDSYKLVEDDLSMVCLWVCPQILAIKTALQSCRFCAILEEVIMELPKVVKCDPLEPSTRLDVDV